MKMVTRIGNNRLESVKFAYNTSRVSRDVIKTLLQGERKPRVGDLVLAQIVEMGQHNRLDLPEGRSAHLFLGEEIVVCYGNSYVPDQYEAVVPYSLDVCSLVSGGGIAAKMLSYHDDMKMPTTIKPIGLLGDEAGKAINLSQFGLDCMTSNYQQRPFTIAVAETGLNAGNTISAAFLTRGLSRSGLSVGAARVTGTGTGKYIWHMKDAGAKTVLDISDAGLPSTYLASGGDVERVFLNLSSSLSQSGLDVLVLEIAGGIFQKETAALMRCDSFRSRVDAILFAAGDSMGAVAGARWLQEHSLPVVAITGSLTRSPLAVREVRATNELPVLDCEGLTATDWKSLLNRHIVGNNAASDFRISLDRLHAIMAMPQHSSLLC